MENRSWPGFFVVTGHVASFSLCCFLLFIDSYSRFIDILYNCYIGERVCVGGWHDMASNMSVWQRKTCCCQGRVLPCRCVCALNCDYIFSTILFIALKDTLQSLSHFVVFLWPHYEGSLCYLIFLRFIRHFDHLWIIDFWGVLPLKRNMSVDLDSLWRKTCYDSYL